MHGSAPSTFPVPYCGMAEKFNTLTLRLGGAKQVKNIVLEGDEHNPDVKIPIGFKRLSIIDTLAMPSATNEIIKKHITGYIETKIAPGGEAAQFQYPPEPLPPLDGEPVVITKSTASVIAILQAAQIAPDNLRYNVGEWAHILSVPSYAETLLRLLNNFVAVDVHSDSWLYEEASESDPLAASGETEPDSSTSQSESSEPTPSL